MNAQVVSAAEMIAENNAQKQSPYTGATMRLLDSILSTNNVMTSNSPVNNLAGMNLQFQVPVNDFLLNHTKSYMEVQYQITLGDEHPAGWDTLTRTTADTGFG